MISSAYLRFVIRLPPICTPPSYPSRVSLITISATMLNRVGDSTHPCLTPLLILNSVDIVPATFTLAFCLLSQVALLLDRLLSREEKSPTKVGRPTIQPMVNNCCSNDTLSIQRSIIIALPSFLLQAKN